MAAYSMNCPKCGKKIEAETQTELGWEYSAHMSEHKK